MFVRGDPGLARIRATGLLCVMGAAPILMFGALGPLIRQDMRIGPGFMGVVGFVYFVSTAVGGRPIGLLLDRVGGRAGLLAGHALSAGSLWLIAGAPASWRWVLLLASVIGGISNAFAQNTGNTILMDPTMTRRRGLSFGVKQASIPTAALVAGTMVALADAGAGWRTMFAVMGVLSLVSLALSSRTLRFEAQHGASGASEEPETRRRPPSKALVFLSAAYGLATMATTSLSLFLVDAASDRGLSLGTAGTILAVGSLGSIAMRLGSGWYSDRREGQVRARFSC